MTRVVDLNELHKDVLRAQIRDIDDRPELNQPGLPDIAMASLLVNAWFPHDNTPRSRRYPMHMTEDKGIRDALVAHWLGLDLEVAQPKRCRPLIFSAEMVLAARDGRKKHTRRVVKPQPLLMDDGCYHWESPHYDNGDGVHYLHTEPAAALRLMAKGCPYGEPGDLLWIREAWQPWVDASSGKCGIYYVADGAKVEDERAGPLFRIDKAGKTRSPIFMPRWACRHVVELTDVRAEPLELSLQGGRIRAEGLRCDLDEDEIVHHCPNLFPCGLLIKKWRGGWDSLNAKRGFPFESNPIVWALAFETVELR